MISGWKNEECDTCRLKACCEGLDTLREPIVKNGYIIGYGECRSRMVKE